MKIRPAYNFIISWCLIAIIAFCQAQATNSFTIKDYEIMAIRLRNLKIYNLSSKNSTVFPDYCFAPPEEGEEDSTLNTRKKRSPSWNETTTKNVTENTTSFDFVEVENNTALTNQSGYIDFSHLSEEFIACPKWVIDEGCYRIMPDGSAYAPLYDKYFNLSEHLVMNNKLFICPTNLTERTQSKFEDAFSIVSTIGMSISTICIILHMIMFILVDTLRNLPGYCLFSLCASLIIGYACFFAIPFLELHDNCTHIGLMMFYFFLASFFWMNILSYDVWRSLRMATSKLRLTTRIWSRFAAYSTYCWGSPGLILLSAVIIDSLGDVPVHYQLVFSTNTCWFTFKEALLAYFAVPFFVLLIVNFIFFIWSFIMITNASMKFAENRNVLWSRLSIFLRLAIIMGLTWIFSVIAAITDEKACWYFFLIFNTTQGVFIFFSFSFGSKTRRAWKSKVQRRKSSVTPTQYSYQSHHLTTTTTV